MNAVGGVCGHNYQSSISNSYNIGSIAGNNSIGGVCGLSSGTIENCYNTETITATDSNAGGICGRNEVNATTSDCFYYGNNKGVGNAEDEEGKTMPLLSVSDINHTDTIDFLNASAKTKIATLKATDKLGTGFNISVVPKSSSNTAIATVSNGVITGVSNGAAIITANIVITQNALTASGFTGAASTITGPELTFGCNVSGIVPPAPYSNPVVTKPEVNPEPKKVEAVIEGNKASVDVPFKDFEHIEIDDEITPKSKYEASSDDDGKLVITFSDELVKELGDGEHKVEVYHANGIAMFSMALGETNPVTGVTTTCVGALVVALGVAFIARKKK